MAQAVDKALEELLGGALLGDPIIAGFSGGRAVGPGTWSPDGKRIAFVWGPGGNPQIWTIPSSGGKPTQITTGPVWIEMTDLVDRRDVAGGPQWSPDGKYFAYAARTAAGSSGIFLIPSNGGAAVQLSDHPRTGVAPELSPHPGCDRTPRWSPDGSKIAFVCLRDGVDQIWIVPVEGKLGPMQLTYDRYDNNDIQWSPDGKQIAFSSQRNGDDIFNGSICVISVKGGAVSQLTEGLTSNDRTPRWSPDGKRIAFVSDRSGWDDIWLMNADGSNPTQLTDGTGDKSDPCWSPDGETILYTATRGGNSDLYIVSLADKKAKRLTSSDGLRYAARWSPDGKEILYLYAGPLASPDLWKRTLDENSDEQLTLTMLGNLEVIDPVLPETRTFQSADGLTVESFLYRPANLEQGVKYPAVIWIHGGPNSLHTNEWYPIFQYLVKKGYVVLAPNSRGSTGYGRSFREDNLDYWGGNDTNDWLAAVDFLKGLGYVDASRIAIWGSSYGGFAVLLALGKFPDVFKAGICAYGPSNLIQSYDDTRVRLVRRLLRRQMKSLPVENMELWLERSPISHVDKVKSPLLIFQGENDAGVHPRQSRTMAEALWAQGKICELNVYEGEGHGFTKPEHIADIAAKVDSFLSRYL